MLQHIEDLKLALSSDHNLIITEDLTEDQALKIANDLYNLNREPTYGEVLEIVKRHYKGEILSKAFESRDQEKTNRLQQTILKMIQSQKNKEKE